MSAILIVAIFAFCIWITAKQALGKPVPHTKGDSCPTPEDPDNKGQHIDFYC